MAVVYDLVFEGFVQLNCLCPGVRASVGLSNVPWWVEGFYAELHPHYNLLSRRACGLNPPQWCTILSILWMQCFHFIQSQDLRRNQTKLWRTSRILRDLRNVSGRRHLPGSGTRPRTRIPTFPIKHFPSCALNTSHRLFLWNVWLLEVNGNRIFFRCSTPTPRSSRSAGTSI